MAVAGGTGESPPAEVAAGPPGQMGQGAECRAVGVVRLDDPGDECTGRPAGGERGRGAVPGAVAGGTAVQAVEIAGLGGGAERRDGGPADGAGVVAAISRAGATLAGPRQCVGRPDEELEQGV